MILKEFHYLLAFTVENHNFNRVLSEFPEIEEASRPAQGRIKHSQRPF